MGGPGRFVDVSMTERYRAQPHAAGGGQRFRQVTHAGPRPVTGGVPCYNVYRTSDRRFMAVGALELKFWESCCEVLGRPDLKRRHWAHGQEVGGTDAMAVKREFDAIFARHTLAEWTEKFTARIAA